MLPKQYRPFNAKR